MADRIPVLLVCAVCILACARMYRVMRRMCRKVGGRALQARITRQRSDHTMAEQIGPLTETLDRLPTGDPLSLSFSRLALSLSTG